MHMRAAGSPERQRREHARLRERYRAYGRDECVAREALNAIWQARERYAPDSQVIT